MNLVYPGAFLHNRYRVLQPIGKGGLSQTFDVDDAGTVKVLKVLNLQRFDNTEGKKKTISLFQREADVLSRLNYPGIPNVDSDGYFVLSEPEQEPIHCLVMEKIHGLNLQQWLEQNNQPMTQDHAVAWLRQLVIILEKLHQEGLIHRDIKPSNIMLKPDGQLALIDFGGVREVTETYLRNITGTGLISPGYTPPEQAEGKAVLQSDYFALGRTLVHLITGTHPIDLDRDPRTGKLLWYANAPQISKPLADLIDYLMALLPSRRPQTPQLILKYLDELTTPAATPSRLEPVLPRSPRQNPPLKRSLLQKLGIVLPSPSRSLISWKRVVPRGTLTGHTGTVAAIAISSEHQLLISGSHDTTIKLWSLRSKTLLQTLNYHRDRITDIALSPTGQCFASSSFDKTISLWSLPEGTLQQTLTRHLHKVIGITFSPNGRILISISSREIYIWSVQSGRLLRSLSDAETDNIRAIAFDAGGKTCIVGYLDGTIEVWNPHTGQRIYTISTHMGGVMSVVISPNSRFLATSVGRTVQLWNAKTYEPLRTLNNGFDGSSAIAFHPNSHVLANGGDREIALWNPQTGQLLQCLTGHTNPIRTVAFSPDGIVLASGSQDQTIKLWLPVP
nr:serine/threonine protein kinase [Leptolyngbyaceae cyanobacterium C42_A2020_001]